MSTIVTLKGAVVASHASNGMNVGSATTVKVLAATAANLEVHSASKAALLGSVGMAAGESIFIEKNPTDELAASDNATTWKFTDVSLEG
jgi:hypothetical protein|tara:strand:+ start:401 stop:667 length:267 start_codon:yes stop_codon:yes gene_type:complete